MAEESLIFKKKSHSSTSLFKSSPGEKSGDIFKKSKKKSSFAPVEQKASAAEKKEPLDALNEEQYESATVSMGHNLIIASAGTGKTSTIVGRVSYLLSNQVLSKEILLLTFTSKAAKEMKERIASFLGEEDTKNLTVGTFHSVCLAKVKKIKPDWTLKLPGEVSLIFKSVFESRIIPEVEGDAPFTASSVYEKYSKFINTSKEGDSFAAWLAEDTPGQISFVDVFEHICDEFEETKKREKVYDFSDLLVIIRDYYKSCDCEYKEIIIDEYQDTNILQTAVIDSMGPESLYCVGDYDQSIYAFNGADIGIIGTFSQRYKNARVSTLYKNYRSSAEILALAEKVINKNPRLYPKKLEVMSKRKDSIVELSSVETRNTQNDKIISRIKLSGDYAGTSILYRSNSSGDSIEGRLKIEEIPYTRKGGTSFFDGKDIAATISLYKILSGDNSLTSFLQAFQICPIKPSVCKMLHSLFKNSNSTYIYQGILSNNGIHLDESSVTENTSMGVTRYRKSSPAGRITFSGININFAKHPLFQYDEINQNAAMVLNLFYELSSSVGNFNSLTPLQLMEKIRKSNFLDVALKHYASRYSKDKSGAIVPLLLSENHKKLKEKTMVLEKVAAKKKNHKNFITSVSTKNDEVGDGDGGVSLLSVHASKGLEFEIVHLIDLNEGVFPNTKLMDNGGGGIEEERRLFYVATTRAKVNYYMYCPSQDFGGKATPPSRFLFEGGLITQ